MDLGLDHEVALVESFNKEGFTFKSEYVSVMDLGPKKVVRKGRNRDQK